MLNAAKAYRRLKEIEEQKLENRLQLLKLEIEKSKTKVQETKSRTQAIKAHKAELDSRHRIKEAELRRREDELVALRLSHERSKQVHTQVKAAQTMTIEESKRQEAARIYEERLKNEEEIRKQRELAYLHAKNMRDNIAQQHEESKNQRMHLLMNRKEQAEKTYRGKLANEASKSQEHEAKVQQLEEQERFLIEELVRAQEAQRKAYAELEAALSQTRQARIQHHHSSPRKNTQQEQQAPAQIEYQK